MNERTDLSRRMISQAEERIIEFGHLLADESRNITTELKRSLNLLRTSHRDMDWITGSPPWFEIPHECIAQAGKLTPLINSLIKSISLQISENRFRRTGNKRNVDHSKYFNISPDGNGILTKNEIERVDFFIKFLEEAPPVDYMALHESAREQRLSEINSMFSDGLSFGEATNAPSILNQPEDKFESDLKAINNDIIEQIEIIEHCLPRWFSMGDFPPPFYAWRIAVILRKAKEYGRESKFLRTYLINFRSRFGGSRKDEILVERAKDMGIDLPPVR